jgi:hypothetical protein
MKKVFVLILLIVPGVVSLAQWNVNSDYTISGKVGIGTLTPRGKLDVVGGDIYLNDDPNLGSGQSIFLPGHIYISPHGNNISYLQARRLDNSGTTSLRLRTYNSGSLTEAMHIEGNGNVGIGTITPLSKLHIANGTIMASDPVYNDINVRLDGNNIPVIKFTRWTGTPSHYHNAFIGQFFNGASGEYSFGIGTGFSATGDQNFNSIALTIKNNSNVGIGTTNPDSKLTVKGHIHAEEVRVDLNVPGPDYVFEENYNLPSLTEVESFIKANKHLPEVPSAKEMEEKGINLSEMNMLLLKKVEELTLYVIEQQKEISNLKNELKTFKTQH